MYLSTHWLIVTILLRFQTLCLSFTIVASSCTIIFNVTFFKNKGSICIVHTASSIAQWQSAGFECGRSRVQSPVKDRLLDSVVVQCWLRVREVPASIPSQGPRHTKNVIKMVPVVPLFSAEHSKWKILALSQELRQENKCNG